MREHGTSTRAVVELFEITVKDNTATYQFWRFTNNEDSNVNYNLNTYTRLPIMIDGVGERFGEAPAQPTLTVSNISLDIQDQVIQYGGMVGSEVVYIRIFEDGEKISETKYIIEQKLSHNKHAISFKLASVLDRASVKLPRRQVLRNDFPGVAKSRIKL